MYKGLFLASLQPIKYLKSFITKAPLLDNTILLRSTWSIKIAFYIGEIYICNFSIIKLYNFFTHFYIWF